MRLRRYQRARVVGAGAGCTVGSGSGATVVVVVVVVFVVDSSIGDVTVSVVFGVASSVGTVVVVVSVVWVVVAPSVLCGRAWATAVTASVAMAPVSTVFHG